MRNRLLPAVFASLLLHGMGFYALTVWAAGASTSASYKAEAPAPAVFRVFFDAAAGAEPARQDTVPEKVQPFFPAEKIVFGGEALALAMPAVSESLPLTEPVAGPAGLTRAESFTGADELRLLLSRLIKEKLVYPPLAQKRNIEGKVGCILLVGEKGQLIQGTISKSSGHTILDKAALDLIQGIFPLGLNAQNPETVSISIEYNLK
jgi:TonB family protein